MTWRRGLGASLVLLVLVVVLSTFGTPTDARVRAVGTPTATSMPTFTPTHTSTPRPTHTSTPTPTPTQTSSPTPTYTPTLTPTAKPTDTPTVTPDPSSPSAHLWLAHPIGPDSEGDRYPGSYFPYGATGAGRYHLHHGVDYANAAGTPVLAAGPGEVIFSGDDLVEVHGLKPDFYGNLVIQELDRRFDGQPVYVLYGHLLEVLVAEGQHGEQGDVVGLVGMTGVAIGNHLHLEVRLGANDYQSTRNPVLWLEPEPGQGVLAGLVLNAKGNPVPEVPVTLFRASDPNKWFRQIQTYALGDINGDDLLGEDFAFGYLPADDYLVKIKIGEKTYVEPVTVNAGEVAFVLIQAQQ